MSVGSWIAAGEVLVTALVIVRMVVVGFIQPAGQLLSWPMFTRGCYITFDFEVYSAASGTRRMNVLDMVMSDSATVTLVQLQWMADYLSERYERVSGQGRMAYAGGTESIRIEDGRVVRSEGGRVVA
jgi:hypothetical protein